MQAQAATSAVGASGHSSLYPKVFMRQKNMRRVILALTPILISAIHFYGWRVLALLAVCQAAGFITEYITCRQRHQPVSEANYVTCWLYALSLPVTCPYWVAVVGVVVAVLFAKEVFGGFGRNFANPAILGRAFVYVCFPTYLTARFVPVFKGFPGGFAQWSFESLDKLPAYLASTGQTVTDAISQATPFWVTREYGSQVTQQAASWLDLFLGNIGGVFSAAGDTRILSGGSAGEGCAVLIILGGLYLLATRTANWRLTLSGLAGVVAANVLFRNLMGYAGLGEVAPLYENLWGGTTLYVLVFMVTDPVSAPKQKSAMLAYGFFIGFIMVLLRWKNIFVAAASFAVLLGNLIAPLLDMAAAAWADRGKSLAAESQPERP